MGRCSAAAANPFQYPCYMHPADEMMGFARAHHHHPHHLALTHANYATMTFQHVAAPNMRPSPSPTPGPLLATVPPQPYICSAAALDLHGSMNHAATVGSMRSEAARRIAKLTDPDTTTAAHGGGAGRGSTNPKQHASSRKQKEAQEREPLRFPEQWEMNRPVHGSRYVYEGRSCRLQWEQDHKTFGFECYEQLRCKFFDGRFQTISTGDIVQLQDSRIYVLLGAARDVVPRNHQYDTWMICYNFAGYRGMEVVFVELKWLESVLSGNSELPLDHPSVNYESVEDVLERFTTKPSFHRRHSIASAKFRTARGQRDGYGSKTSDDDYNAYDSY